MGNSRRPYPSKLRKKSKPFRKARSQKQRSSTSTTNLKIRANYYCSVRGCKSSTNTNRNLIFHDLPSRRSCKRYVTNEMGINELIDVRNVWIKKLKLEETVTNDTLVCELHFADSDYFNYEARGRVKSSLKRTAIPSLNLSGLRSGTPSENPGPSIKMEIQETQFELHEQSNDIKVEIEETQLQLPEQYNDIKVEMEETQLELHEQYNDIKDELQETQLELHQKYNNIKDDIPFPGDIVDKPTWRSIVTTPRCYVNSHKRIVKQKDLNPDDEEIKTKSNSLQGTELESKQAEIKDGIIQSSASFILNYEHSYTRDIDSRNDKLPKDSLYLYNDKGFKCRYCDYNSNRQRIVEKHTHRIHLKTIRYQCEICGKTFFDLRRLNTHHRVHTGEKLYKCTECDFRTNKSLSEHMKIHTGEKPHHCNVCEFKTAVKSRLKLHMRTHTGEKPFKCLVCTDCFTHKVSLINHMKKHSVVPS